MDFSHGKVFWWIWAEEFPSTLRRGLQDADSAKQQKVLGMWIFPLDLWATAISSADLSLQETICLYWFILYLKPIRWVEGGFNYMLWRWKLMYNYCWEDARRGGGRPPGSLCLVPANAATTSHGCFWKWMKICLKSCYVFASAITAGISSRPSWLWWWHSFVPD